MDSKALIKIEFQIYGQKYETEMYINYFPNPQIDDRIVEWFEKNYISAFDNYKNKKWLRIGDATATLI